MNVKKRRQANGHYRPLEWAIAHRSFYDNLDVLIDEEMAELMKDPEVRAMARRISIEMHELLVRKMKEKWLSNKR